MASNRDPLELASGLIRCPSVTPHEGGALDFLVQILEPAGFRCHRLPFSQSGTADVDNLYARIGTRAPHLSFAGHTDVVPVGDEASWTSPPFEASVLDGILTGRGSADMKGGIACFLAATLDYLEDHGGEIPGSISFLITGDEEGPAVNGTVKMIDWLKAQGEAVDHCLVGEPTNPEALGDAIKIGRRGSLTGELVITGIQGHVAYPEKAANPLAGAVSILNILNGHLLDEGSDHFDPSNLEVTSVDVGNSASNVIPARVAAKFNIRFNDRHSADSLKGWIAQIVEQELKGTALKSDIVYEFPSDCFVTEPGPLVDILRDSIDKVTGRRAELSTSGGTSDARFIKDICPVVEFGLVNKTIHQVDEHVEVADLYRLKDIYRLFLDGYFATIKT